MIMASTIGPARASPMPAPHRASGNRYGAFDMLSMPPVRTTAWSPQRIMVSTSVALCIPESRPRTPSTSTFFVPPTFATLPTARGGCVQCVQYRVLPTPRLPAPNANSASVKLGTRLTICSGLMARGYTSNGPAGHENRTIPRRHQRTPET